MKTPILKKFHYRDANAPLESHIDSSRIFMLVYDDNDSPDIFLDCDLVRCHDNDKGFEWVKASDHSKINIPEKHMYYAIFPYPHDSEDVDD